MMIRPTWWSQRLKLSVWVRQPEPSSKTARRLWKSGKLTVPATLLATGHSDFSRRASRPVARCGLHEFFMGRPDLDAQLSRLAKFSAGPLGMAWVSFDKWRIKSEYIGRGRRMVGMHGVKKADDTVCGRQKGDGCPLLQAEQQAGCEEPGQEGHRCNAMRAVLTHRIALVPTAAQEVLLRQAVGVSRFAYNWALAEWKRQCEAGEKPNEAALRRQLNAIKRGQFPWMLMVPKTVPQQAIKNCGSAFQRFFKKQGRYPKFKKKGVHDAARLDNGPGTFKFDGNQVRLPVIGWVKLREELRFSGKALSATVRRVADRWFVCVPVEVELPESACENQAAVGIDLGVSTAVTLSSGEKLVGPKAFHSHLERLRRLSRRHTRKKEGSNNRRKSAMRLGRLHARISNIRQDWLHQTTTRVVMEFSVIGIEDLNVRGMLANPKLARKIADIGFYEFRRQLKYKAKLNGAELVIASRWFPSSKKCSVCGRIAEELPLSVREWACQCGAVHDREINGAMNLRQYALDRASCARINACGEEGSGAGFTVSVKPASVKQEVSPTSTRG